jgi:hypothetical protein
MTFPESKRGVLNMPMCTHIIKKKISETENSVELAYYTEEMIKDGIAIREIRYRNHEWVARTSLSFRCMREGESDEVDLYFGETLAPVQVFRIVKDIVEMYNSYFLEDFVDIVKDMLENEKQTIDNFLALEYMGDDIRNFFDKINQE